LQLAQNALEACAEEYPQLALVVEELPVSHLDQAAWEIALLLGPAPAEAGFAVQLGWEEVVIIAHPDNPVHELDLQTLRGLFSGDISGWSQAMEAEVQPWILPEGDETRAAFDAIVMPGEAYSSQARLAASSEAMLAGVAANPAAVGFLPRAWLNTEAGDKVKLVVVEESLGERLRLPVLALADSTPEGINRTYLACLQNGPGADLLAEMFANP
jgi:phosphate transport system substrate-binding protein